MSFYTQYVSFATIFKAEMRRIFRIWPQTLLPPLITTTLYFIVFGKLLGSQLGRVEDISYMEYIVPGLIMNTIIINSYMNCVSTVFSSKFGRSIQEIMISPTNNFVFIFGYVFASAFRGIFTGFLVCLVALFFTDLSIASIPWSIFLAFLTAIIFSLIGFLNGIFARKFDDTTWVTSFVLTPLTYLGGVFYSIEMLPPIWRDISLMNPISYIISSFKNSFLGVSYVSLENSLIVMLAMLIAIIALNMTILRLGIRVRS